MIKDIFYYQNYYLEFFEKLKPEVKKKFNWTLQLIATIDRVPEKYFKYMTGSTGIFEIRVEVGSEELELAEKLKKQYFDEKDK